MIDNKLDINATVDEFHSKMNECGWVFFDKVLDNELVDQINLQLVDAYELRRDIQVQNGIEANTDGTLHHLVEADNFSIPFLENMYCDKFMKDFFHGNYILNSFGGVLNFKGSKPYVQNVHRDVRSFTGDVKLMINMLVLLDDFTLENGATYFLTGSHHQDAKPNDELFYNKADRAVGKKGSIILFDSHLWHATGYNTTDNQRRALTLTFTRPYIKQQLDYPRFLGYDNRDGFNENLKQVLGYNARVAASLQEYYQPPHKRMYMPGQG